MREVLYSKLVFVDSHDGLKGSKTLRPSFHVPTNAFSCGQGEAMRMVLKSFTMPKMFRLHATLRARKQNIRMRMSTMNHQYLCNFHTKDKYAAL